MVKIIIEESAQGAGRGKGAAIASSGLGLDAVVGCTKTGFDLSSVGFQGDRLKRLQNIFSNNEVIQDGADYIVR